ncbi:L-type lectin-domain containing receptor kinase IX.1-like isoform X1 [Nicotiana tabacum]|uniref:L-type lectin-domain containing receptor kinase IX.1-like isoform X1 n=4 Tax=Nicotiana tabacum TaxID=4097 RepID=A0AC58ULL0_TOBAC|nr:PREDICTED: L-type lectin-domain containing receptor kinase IX.1-like [Nicotiana tabacum]
MVVFASLSALKYLVFLLIITPFATSLSFNFDSFRPSDQNVTYERDAYPADGAIQLTIDLINRHVNASIGRATYSKPLHLWDKASGNVTDFSTHFSFSINSKGRTRYGDGLAFFLAPAGSRTPENTTRGGSLGLTSNTQRLNTSSNHFVAVEFDTYQNVQYDPKGDHVGIDINSMQSVVNVTWFSSIPNGRRTDAWISYNSTSKNLTVVFTGFKDNSTVTVLQSLSHNLDLREYLPEWVTFGFTGGAGLVFALQSIYSWNFTSSLEVNDNITNPGVVLPRPKPEHAQSKNKLGLVVGLVSGGCVLVFVCVLMLFAFWRKRKLREDEDNDIFDGSMTHEFERSTGPKKFLYRELARCTNSFAQENKLGEGGFGGVYKGYLRELNSYVAVKRVSRESKQGIKEYASEVSIISRLRHRHLVQLIGWCHEKRELLLVYEFMPNGSLDFHLFKGKSHLTWPIRYKIAQGLASTLLYLHEEWEQCVVHRDIKSSNIMLDSNFNAKLGDFGLARLVDHEKGSQTTVLAGTRGYMAPECFITGKASKETDVYSFGVVALEIACGRKAIDPKAEEDQVKLVDWVWSLYGMGNLNEAADPKLLSEFNEMETKHLLIVGLWCAHPDSKCRPSIRQAIHVLNFEAPLPTLPPNMPVPTYCSHYSVNRDNTDSSNTTTAYAASSSSASILYPR